MKRLLLGMLCVGLSGVALAGGLDAVRKSVQASMLISGTIDVAADGGVANYAVDQPEKLPPVVAQLIAKAIPNWRFAPVVMEGKPVTAKARMSLRIVATPAGDGKYAVGIAGAVFGDGKGAAVEAITERSMKSAIYPSEALESHVAGTVYLLIRIDRQGKVAEVVARQVNLRVIDTDRELAKWRRVLAGAALRAARQWTFNPPTAGKSAADPYWQVNIPVDFHLAGPYAPAIERVGYGQWRPYVPGPVQEIPWADKRMIAGSVDAMPDQGIFQANSALHLLTSLGGI